MDIDEELDDHRRLLYSFYSACGAFNNAATVTEPEETCSNFIEPLKIVAEPVDSNTCTSDSNLTVPSPAAKPSELSGCEFVCFHCNRNFKSKSRIRWHVVKVCDSTNASSRKHASRHIRLSKNPEQRRKKRKPKSANICPFCGHIARKPCELRLHLNAQHTGERPFSCKECGVGFTSKSKLNRHIKNRVHTKGKFYCKSCKLYFSVEDNYKLHVLKHTLPPVKMKPFACPHCEKRFNRSDILRKHLNVHSDKNKNAFKCVACDHSFSQKYSLSQHIARKLCRKG